MGGEFAFWGKIIATAVPEPASCHSQRGFEIWYHAKAKLLAGDAVG
jgi:hypothetical protein